MRVRVRATSGVATLNVENDWTMLDLKAAIENKLNVPVKSQIRTCFLPLRPFPPPVLRRLTRENSAFQHEQCSMASRRRR